MKFTHLIIFSLLFLFACTGGDNDSAPTEDSSKITEETQGTPAQPEASNRIHVRNIGPLQEVFNDSNHIQLIAAKRLGIDPISTLASSYFTKRPIIHIKSNDYYNVDTLSHSLPFLVPEAAVLLHDIGRNFIDSLSKRGADGYKIKVTSLLRTPSTVKSLRKININATDSSTHQFGTTFDISYVKFFSSHPSIEIEQGDLKNLLAEVLFDLRADKRCYVKYERKTGCFHVTVAH